MKPVVVHRTPIFKMDIMCFLMSAVILLTHYKQLIVGHRKMLLIGIL